MSATADKPTPAPAAVQRIDMTKDDGTATAPPAEAP
jgi:hypothetical protein